MRILGLSAFYHDSAAALLVDGELVAAAQEERFTRKKHDAGFPKNAVEYCLAEGGIDLDQVDHIAFYDKPFLKFERLLETYLAFAPKGFTSFRMAVPVWLKEKLFQKRLLRDHLMECGAGKDVEAKLLFTEHHQSHAASAFFPSPFEEAAVLTIDGVGEWATTSVGLGRGNRLEMLKELHFPHSLGLLYSAFTYYTGFKVNSGEYKVMGLAPYGEPKYARLILEHLMDLKDDGTFRLNQEYFNYCTGLTMTNGKFDELFGGKPRKPDELVRQRDMDLAASIQVVTEEVMLRLTRALAQETGQKHLCLAGGVALNCVANGKILRDGALRAHLDPAGGRRCRRRTRGRVRRLSSVQGPAAPVERRARRHARRLSRPRLRPGRDRAAPGRCRRGVRRAARGCHDRLDRGGAGRREGGRLVPGPHGVRAARARRAARSWAMRARRPCSAP